MFSQHTGLHRKGCWIFTWRGCRRTDDDDDDDEDQPLPLLHFFSPFEQKCLAGLKNFVWSAGLLQENSKL